MPSQNLPTSRDFATQLLRSLSALPPLPADISNTAAGSHPLENAPEPARKQLLALHVLFPNELLPALDLLDRRLTTRFRIRRNQGNSAGDAASSGVRRHADAQIEAVAQSIHDQVDRAEGASAPRAPLTHSTGQVNISDVEMPDAPQLLSAGVQTEVESAAVVCNPHKDIDTVYYVRSAQQKTSRFSTSYDSTTSYEVRLRAWNCSCPAFAFSAFPSVHPDPPIPTYDPALGPASVSLHNTEDFGGMSLGDGMPPVCKHLLACVLVERCSSLFGSFVEEKEVSVEEAAGWAAGWGD